MKKIIVVGCGGVGSFLTPPICLLKEPSQVTVVDGDTLEEKNLNRQLFDEHDIGDNKAECLAAKYHCFNFIPSFYSHGSIELDESDWLLCCVDNNPGRKAVLNSCDAYGCKAIFGANEMFSAEAYYYEPKWKGTAHDPRVYYPEILTDDSDDPRAASIGCVGEIQKANRQLVSANFSAASLMLDLFVNWNMERSKFDKEAMGHLPYRVRKNQSRYETTTLKGTKL